MSPRSPTAFLLSATFHVLVVGFACLFALDSCQEHQPPKVLELVAGEGDNYGATVAPKLGNPDGPKLAVPAIPLPPVPEPQPQPPREPVPEPKTVPPPPEPKPVVPTPEPKTVVTPAPKPPPKPIVKKAPSPTPNFSRQITRKVIRAESKAKAEVAKHRAAEEKRLKKEEFDRQQRAKVAAAKAARSVPHFQHIDSEGIARGVVDGSAENKRGGAGGHKLVVTDGAVTDRYFQMLKEKVLNAIDKPPGVSDDLTVTVSVHLSASGRLSGARVLKSSGSEDFDRAVLAAFGRVSMPEHPEHKNEDLELEFRTRDAGNG